MELMNVNRLLNEILIRGEQLANLEGAGETARLLQSTASLINYFGDERSWGPAGDELNALRDYGNVIRACFGRKMRIDCALPEDLFIRRRVLLNELLKSCSTDRILMDKSDKAIDVRISVLENGEDGTLCALQVSFDGSDEGVACNCKC